ncbi:MAG: hypothetical protein LLG37_05685 [Spirochaetia bacterium]|nr:hypothetical protein [Spirochaetia bacterium]
MRGTVDFAETGAMLDEISGDLTGLMKLKNLMRTGVKRKGPVKMMNENNRPVIPIDVCLKRFMIIAIKK